MLNSTGSSDFCLELQPCLPDFSSWHAFLQWPFSLLPTTLVSITPEDKIAELVCTESKIIPAQGIEDTMQVSGGGMACLFALFLLPS